MFLAVMQPLLHGKCFTIVNIFQISSMAHQCEQYSTLELQSFNPGGGGGDSYMKQTGMLIVLLRDVNFGFWSRLGCSRQSANILSCQGLI